VPVAVAQTLDEALAVVALAGLGSVGTSVREGTDYTEFDWSQPFALVLGNEAAVCRSRRWRASTTRR